MAFIFDNHLQDETLKKFEIHKTLLSQWNRNTALVQKETLLDVNNRHFLDSLQLIPIFKSLHENSFFQTKNLDHANPKIHENLLSTYESKLDIVPEDIQNFSLLDVGSGAGFPGLVLAMCGFKNVTLCESNHKKCLFLEEVARQTKVHVKISCSRVEKLTDKFDIMISRACTDLNNIFFMMHSKPNEPRVSMGIFHKGKSWKDEIYDASKNWSFELLPYKSFTSQESVILVIKNLKPNQ